MKVLIVYRRSVYTGIARGKELIQDSKMVEAATKEDLLREVDKIKAADYTAQQFNCATEGGKELR